jgi:hypothetical protein
MIKDISLLENEARNKIRTLYNEGKNWTEIRAILDIPENTWYSYYWQDKQGFRRFIKDIENDYLRDIAKKNIKDIASMDIKDIDDVRYLKIKADMSTFIAETLDKEDFSKKTEDKGDERTPINIQVNTYKKIQNLKKRLAPPSKP